MSHITTNNQSHYLVTALLTGLLAFTSLHTASASESPASTRSISYSVTTQSEPSTKQTQSNLLKLKQAELQTLPAISKQGYRSESTRQMSSSYYGDFSIHDASVELFNDYDYDGFYHHFSVTLDADTVYSNAHVYAELYISYEGGPWNYYAGSDVFTIYGDSASDAFVIETELVEGFPAGYYDIRIDLYDAHNNAWLLSYGPYADSSLSTLPLEDSYSDSFYDGASVSYQTDVYVHGNGSMNVWSLLLLAALAIIARRFSRRVAHS
ncbi:MAG TPA: choice-of-anchor H family protein [Gammaproteobacteria bacterium]